MNKAITLEDIDFRAKARVDLPYLKDKAMEYLNKYAKNSLNDGDMEERKRFLKLHFSYMEFYHGTKIVIEEQDSNDKKI